jgi:hypothetical protein
MEVSEKILIAQGQAHHPEVVHKAKRAVEAKETNPISCNSKTLFNLHEKGEVRLNRI